MSERQSCIYVGTVMHQRVRPQRHRLRYRVFSLFLDLDELPALGAALRLFSYGGSGVLSFRDRDHGPGEQQPLRPWVEKALDGAGIDIAGGPIRLLCYPRVFGYVFNPLTVYYCYHRAGGLAAVLYEVNNTFGERHCYLIPVQGSSRQAIRQECDKTFYVSPFIDVSGRYVFRLTSPAERLSLSITQKDEAGPLLHAAFQAQREPLDDRTIARCLVRCPLLTLKVIGGIHWEALRLWAKGVPLVRRPPPPAQPITIVMPSH